MKTAPYFFMIVFLLFSFLTVQGPQGIAAELADRPGNMGSLNPSTLPAPETLVTAPDKTNQPDDGASDHFASVFEVKGDVRVLKNGKDEWQPAVKGMVLEVGDQIITGKDGQLDIAYDHQFLNIARIKENTKGEFRSIEPTNLFLEDGTIFNALDGLAGQSYQISTPTAVAGVRGTTFDVIFDAETKALDMNVYPDFSEHQGIVDVTTLEGDIITIKEGHAWDHQSQSIVEVPAERVEEVKGFLSGFEEFRDAPPVLGETDDRKPGQGPHDGNGPGDGSGSRDYQKFDGTMTSGDPNLPIESDMDAFLDKSLEPPAAGFEERSYVSTTAGEFYPGQKSEGETKEDSSAGTHTPRPDIFQMASFLNVGGVDEPGEGSRYTGVGSAPAFDYSNFFVNTAGMDPRTAEKMEEGIKSGDMNFNMMESTMPMPGGDNYQPYMAPSGGDYMMPTADTKDGGGYVDPALFYENFNTPGPTGGSYTDPYSGGGTTDYVDPKTIIQDYVQGSGSTTTGYPYPYPSGSCPGGVDSAGNCI